MQTKNATCALDSSEGKAHSLFVVRLSKVTMADTKYHVWRMVVCALEFL